MGTGSSPDRSLTITWVSSSPFATNARRRPSSETTGGDASVIVPGSDHENLVTTGRAASPGPRRAGWVTIQTISPPTTAAAIDQTTARGGRRIDPPRGGSTGAPTDGIGRPDVVTI